MIDDPLRTLTLKLTITTAQLAALSIRLSEELHDPIAPVTPAETLDPELIWLQEYGATVTTNGRPAKEIFPAGPCDGSEVPWLGYHPSNLEMVRWQCISEDGQQVLETLVATRNADQWTLTFKSNGEEPETSRQAFQDLLVELIRTAESVEDIRVSGNDSFLYDLLQSVPGQVDESGDINAKLTAAESL